MTETSTGIARRTLAKGAAWAVPTVAVAAAAPVYAASGITTTTTTLPPCIADVAATGGTYPVNYNLSGCTTDGTHWDFQFLITAQTAAGTDCSTCNYLRITLFDNPKRTRLWITGQANIIGGDPATNTNNYHRLYVQKVLQAGTSDTFPKELDEVRRVAGPDGNGNYTSFITSNTVVGNIEALGGYNDTVHTLFNADGSIPCGASGPMAYYKVECSANGTTGWVQKGNIGQINPCIPMIASTVCRLPDGRFRLGVSILKPCDEQPSSFKVTDIRRNSDPDRYNQGSSVYNGNDVTLTGGTKNIETTSVGSGTYLWIAFTTDDGDNTSWIRIGTTNTNC